MEAGSNRAFADLLLVGIGDRLGETGQGVAHLGCGNVGGGVLEGLAMVC